MWGIILPFVDMRCFCSGFYVDVDMIQAWARSPAWSTYHGRSISSMWGYPPGWPSLTILGIRYFGISLGCYCQYFFDSLLKVQRSEVIFCVYFVLWYFDSEHIKGVSRLWWIGSTWDWNNKRCSSPSRSDVAPRGRSSKLLLLHSLLACRAILPLSFPLGWITICTLIPSNWVAGHTDPWIFTGKRYHGYVRRFLLWSVLW